MKLASPLSPGDAFWASIVALPPDQNGRSRWTRAVVETGLSEAHLRKCASGERPIRLQDAELFDRINSIAGGPPDNEEALQARRLATLAGLATEGVDPVRYGERVVSDLSRMTRSIKFGKGEPTQLRAQLDAIHQELSEMLAAIKVREAEAQRNRERRASDSEMRIVGSDGNSR